jgi:hypothetical protein
MPAYDDTLFDPPAPLARVTLRNPSSRLALSDVPNWGVMGRDVLNLVALLFDGPNLTWNEQV